MTRLQTEIQRLYLPVGTPPILLSVADDAHGADSSPGTRQMAVATLPGVFEAV